MLKFDEAQRPSFVELGKMFLTEENDPYKSRDKRKKSVGKENTQQQALPTTEKGKPVQVEDSQANLMTQSELFRAYSDQNNLYLNLTSHMMWFEFGGSRIAKLTVDNEEQ